jgi:hypothetical protein
MRAIRNKNKYVITGAIFAVFMVFNSGFAHAGGISPSEVIDLVNQSRSKNNLESLKENHKLSQAAMMKAEDMIKNDYFAHTSPQGKTPWYWLEKGGYDYKYAGENLAVNYTDAGEQHSAWMSSSSHRDNILNANYQEIGVAVVEGDIDGEKTILTVQLFGMPVAVAASPQKDPSDAPDAALVPAVKSASAVSERSSNKIGTAPFAIDRTKYVLWLVLTGILALSVASNIINIFRMNRLKQEEAREKSGSQKIKVECEDFLEIITINVRNSKSMHPLGGPT